MRSVEQTMEWVAESVTPQQAHAQGWTIVDVRSASERAVACVPQSLHVPLERIDIDTGTWREGRVALLCKGGVRAQMAQERLARCGVSAVVIEGGIDRWMQDGLPVSRASYSRWSIERQVRFGAGLLVLVGTLAAVLLSRRWLLLTGFVGAGLTFAGATDICMMGDLLARMPWNRIRSGA